MLSLHFADSEVAAVDAAPGGVLIRLSAAHVEQAGAAPGDRPAAGFSRGVVLLLDAAEPPPPGAALFGRLFAGRIRLGEQWHARLTLPSSQRGPVRLELAFANHAQLTLSAQGVACRFESDPNFTESMAC
ncbi:hypothetical protein [Aquabacterium humicola]|uniref:hypothetical protein n=1 Tax=Aquabacterium humicola TaxID=3237377 RepID=UPI00254384B1|nr:hypothetical protein [Rubrivivax pictus]